MRPVHPPARLLMGPGPVDADPRVLRALSTPLVGQYDPWTTRTMTEAQQLWRDVWGTTNDATVLVDGTSRAGIEAVLGSLLAPGDAVVVPVAGRFGLLLTEIARRAGAEVHVVEAPWGTVVPFSEIERVVTAVRPRVLATVHGDTSTTMVQPLAELGELCARHGVLLYTDATATLGGVLGEVDAWGVDAASTGLQKCLGGPSGSAPVTLSERAVAALGPRRSVEAGLRLPGDPVADEPVRSNYLDLPAILDHWGPRRLNHHTEAASMLYAAHECARVLLEEGREAFAARHETAGRAVLEGVRALGLRPYGDDAHRLPHVLGVHVPDGLDGEAVRRALLEDHAIEIGTSFGPLHGRIWRIGSMGRNARRDAVVTTIAALEHVLRRAGVPVPLGAGVDAALAVHAEADR